MRKSGKVATPFTAGWSSVPRRLPGWSNPPLCPIAIGHNGGLLQPGNLRGTLLQPAVNGVATFPDLRIDQAGTAYYTLVGTYSNLRVESNPCTGTLPESAGPARL